MAANLNAILTHSTNTPGQWFSTTVLKAACGPQAPFVRPSEVFQ